jgi:hypothetical protein
MYQQLWGYKVEEKLYLGVREQKRLNTTGSENAGQVEIFRIRCGSTPLPHMIFPAHINKRFEEIPIQNV